ncbi:MAG TPA: response regulator transcription factor [Elusimicrobiota bacterium]|nr:response regulator transcription factor [Elusimicrobiota bacterium]
MARILSIEDDPDFQHLLGLTLRQHGYEVHFAFDGQDGYQKVLSLSPDLVLLDLNLPGMNGIEVIRALQANRETRAIPILVTSAYGDAANMLAHSVRALGALEFLPKPVEMKELLLKIKTGLRAAPRPAHPAQTLSKGAVRADPRFRTVWIEDKLAATLAPRRFLLLQALMESPGSVSREKLKEKVWGKAIADNALEKAVQRLREDLGPSESRRIQTTLDGYELVG